MLLVITYSRTARQLLQNVCLAHEDSVIRRFGRAALFEGTEFGAPISREIASRRRDEAKAFLRQRC